jgi:pyridoxal phosphate enzyme (YggS family)
VPGRDIAAASAEGTFKQRLEAVLNRMEQAARRAGRDASEVKLIAVTKGVPVERVQEALASGCRSFGENRAQEALAKIESLGQAPGLEWHFIGPLQTNKIRFVLGRFVLIHSIDRMEAAERMDALARARGLVQPVLLEVNVAGERTKHGFEPDVVLSAAERMSALSGLRVLGLMAIPPPASSPQASRPYFRDLRMLAARVEARGIPGVSMRELSMGMSADFETAIEEGATMVRIGTALFGPRPGERAMP